MNDFETLTKQLIRDEGMILHAYQDHLGFWTIGAGRLIDVRKGGSITLEEGLYLLKNDILTHIKAVSAHLSWADHNVIGAVRFGALVNMHFQLGNGLWNFTKTLEHMELGEWDKAANEMLDSTWAKQTPERAKRISEQVRTNKWV